MNSLQYSDHALWYDKRKSLPYAKGTRKCQNVSLYCFSKMAQFKTFENAFFNEMDYSGVVLWICVRIHTINLRDAFAHALHRAHKGPQKARIVSLRDWFSA